MYLKVTVDGVDHNLKRLIFAEGVAVEKTVGKTLGKVLADAEAGGAEATQALVWIALKRQKPELTFAEVADMAFEDVGIEMVEEDEPAEDPSPAADSED